MITYSYKRDLSHNYLVIEGQGGAKSYQLPMLQKNQIEGLLPCTVRYLDNHPQYCYDISSRQSLQQAFSLKKINYIELKRIIYQIQEVIREAEKYLLDSSRILLSTEYAYWDFSNERAYFVYFPENQAEYPQEKGRNESSQEENSLARFAENLLELIDHTDEDAVDTAYRLYDLTREDNFIWDSIINFMEESKGMKGGASNTLQRSIDLNTAGKDQVQEHEKSCGEEETEEKERGENAGDTGCPAEDKLQNRGGQGRTLLFTAAIGMIVLLSVLYLWNNYVFTRQELMAGAAAALITAILLCIMLFRHKRDKNIGDEGEEMVIPKTAYEEEWEREEKCPEYAREPERADAHREELNMCAETVYLCEEAEPERRLDGRIKGQEISVFMDDMPFIIGKLKEHVSYVLNDLSVSRMHAKFEEQDGKVLLSDLNSKNGTFKNEIRLEAGERLEVKPGDEIRFGKIHFTYH